MESIVNGDIRKGKDHKRALRKGMEKENVN